MSTINCRQSIPQEVLMLTWIVLTRCTMHARWLLLRAFIFVYASKLLARVDNLSVQYLSYGKPFCENANATGALSLVFFFFFFLFFLLFSFFFLFFLKHECKSSVILFFFCERNKKKSLKRFHFKLSYMKYNLIKNEDRVNLFLITL